MAKLLDLLQTNVYNLYIPFLLGVLYEVSIIEYGSYEYAHLIDLNCVNADWLLATA